MDTDDKGATRLRDLPERNTRDKWLRTAQQHHVHRSATADTKANVVIAMSSILLTLVLGRLIGLSLHPALAVLSTYRPLRRSRSDAPRPSQCNGLFFGHFAERLLKPDGGVHGNHRDPSGWC